MQKKNLWLLLIFFILLFSVSCSSSNDNIKDHKNDNMQDITVVTTKNGDVKGTMENNIVAFKGIPFAQPPVGDLRFAPPKPVKSWQGILDCTNFKPSPPQNAHLNDSEYDEDCLYLNIWVPQDALTSKQKENYPVLVFIHGGAFATGSASDPLYDGTAFANQGIICVTVEYRLNALGFLATEEMKNTYGYAGNFGILDQIQSLKWIHENIGSFGGDNNNITISGESAGAFSVSNLIFSPLAEGLFQQAIMESGTLFAQQIIGAEANGDEKTALAAGKRFMEELGVSTLEELRQIDVQTFVDHSVFSANLTSPSPHYFMPVFDGQVIEKDPYQSLQNGDYNNVKILMGYNTDEGTIFIPEGITEEKYKSLVEHSFGQHAPEILNRFPVDANHSATDRARELVNIGFQMGCYIFGESFSQQGKEIYIYNFDYRVPQLEQSGLGVVHGLELPFVFHSFPDNIALTEENKKFIDEVHQYWVSFIKTGDPNKGSSKTPGAPNWPAYTHDQKNIMQLNADSKVISLPNEEELHLISNSLIFR